MVFLLDATVVIDAAVLEVDPEKLRISPCSPGLGRCGLMVTANPRPFIRTHCWNPNRHDRTGRTCGVVPPLRQTMRPANSKEITLFRSRCGRRSIVTVAVHRRDARPEKEHAPGENAMFEILDRQARLTGNQIKILAAAIIGDALEFFDYFLIGFVLAFLIGPWKLTFGQSAIVLMSSGIGAIIGAFAWGWLADRIGRRKVFIATVLNFSVATGLLYFTPDNGWIYLSVMRFFVGVGVGGLYCVDLPLVQEFMPSSKRGWVGGLVTCVIPLGTGPGAVLGAFVSSDQWRLLFALVGCPRHWCCWCASGCRNRRALALPPGPLRGGPRVPGWALQVEPSTLPMPTAADAGPVITSNWLDLFKYPRSLLVSWLGNAGAQTGVYGITLWAPSLFVLLLKVSPQQAAKMMILLTVFGFVGRISFSFFLRADGTPQCRWPPGLRRRRPDHRGRLQLRRHAVRRLGVLADSRR